jgi:hypothetical protein
VAPSFDPQDVAQTLNSLTAEQIIAMKEAARQAAAHFLADTELANVVTLVDRVLG